MAAAVGRGLLLRAGAGVAGDLPAERFYYRRARYSSAGKDQTGRLKRRYSVPAQNLRAQVARFLDWFRVLLRHGWLGSHRNRTEGSPFMRDGIGEEVWIDRLNERRRKGLDLPIGPRAIALGLAPPDKPPPPPAAQ